MFSALQNQLPSRLYSSFSTKCCDFALAKFICGRKETVPKPGDKKEEMSGTRQDFFINCS